MSHRLRVAAAFLEKWGLGIALLAFLGPFLGGGQNSIRPVAVGAQAFFAVLFLFLVPHADALRSYLAFVMPVFAALFGLLLPRRLTWPASIARLACALAGLAGLGSFYFSNPRPHLLIGYYAAEAAFLVAAIASAFRLVAALRLRGRYGESEPEDPGPALSASQELLRRHRDG